jgi:diguanylate cyclase (GGDEF)-like protein
MHGRRDRRSSPLGNAPFKGIATLAAVFAIVILIWAAWQYRAGQAETQLALRERSGLHFVSEAFATLVDWSRLQRTARDAADARTEADVAALERSAATMQDVPEALAAARSIRSAWNATRGAGAAAPLGEALLDGMARVADSSGLAFESEPEANDLGDALDNPLALQFERLNAAYARIREGDARGLPIPERLFLAEESGAAEAARAPLLIDLNGAFNADPDARARLEKSWRDTDRAAAAMQSTLSAIARGNGALNAPAAEAAHERLIGAASGFSRGLGAAVAARLDERLDQLHRDGLATAVQAVLALGLCFGSAYLIGGSVIRRQRRALFRAQRDSAAEQFRAVFERAPIGIALLDRTGATLEANAGLAAILDGPARVIVAGDPEFAALVEGRLDLYRFEHHWTCAEGRALCAEVTVSPVGGRHHGPVAAIAMVQDVTERRASDASLRYAATHDALTSLPNRPEFIRRLSDVLAGETGARGRYAVLFIDLDGFKAVNDRLGHQAGDRVIQIAAQRLRKASRASDVVARFHGDEFGLILFNIDGIKVANIVAERIHEELRAPIVIDDSITFVAPSIGVVLGDERYAHAEDVLRDADAAMYRAKSLGGACTVTFEYPAAS